MATVADYSQVLRWITLGGSPCTIRLEALKAIVESGDKRVQTLDGSGVTLVVDVLRTIDLEDGDKTWFLGGYQCARKVRKLKFSMTQRLS